MKNDRALLRTQVCLIGITGTSAGSYELWNASRPFPNGMFPDSKLHANLIEVFLKMEPLQKTSTFEDFGLSNQDTFHCAENKSINAGHVSDEGP